MSGLVLSWASRRLLQATFNAAIVAVVVAGSSLTVRAQTPAFKVGDCVSVPSSVPDYAFEDLSQVPCTESHIGEVFVVSEYAAGRAEPFPGDRAINRFVTTRCQKVGFRRYVGERFASSELEFTSFQPDAQSWHDGDRQIVCYVTMADEEPFVGSINPRSVTTEPAEVPMGYRAVTINTPELDLPGHFVPRAPAARMLIPESWIFLDASRKNVGSDLQAFRAQRPELAAALPASRSELREFGALLLATDTAPTAHFSTVIVDFDASTYFLPTAESFTEDPDFLAHADDVAAQRIKLDTSASRRAFVESADVKDWGEALEVHDISRAYGFHNTAYFMMSPEVGLLRMVFLTADDGRQDEVVQTMVRSFKILD